MMIAMGGDEAVCKTQILTLFLIPFYSDSCTWLGVSMRKERQAALHLAESWVAVATANNAPKQNLSIRNTSPIPALTLTPMCEVGLRSPARLLWLHQCAYGDEKTEDTGAGGYA